MSLKGTLKTWLDRSSKTSNSDESEAIDELLNHIKVDENEFLDSDPESDINRFYANQSVFITGGSGFLGKTIVEKLLRSCPDVKEIYILIRPKRGVDIETRIKLMLHLSLFDRVRSKPDGPKLLATKIIPMNGDITQPMLGLSHEDLILLRSRVNIIINSAASIRFNEPVGTSTQLNVISVDSLMRIANKMQKLKAIVHISTCYANCDQHVVEEKFYDSPIDPDELMELVSKSKTSDDSKQLEDLLVKAKRPNSYTFTKSVGEALLLKRSKELSPKVSICIVRPSIICATWREPIRGWIDNTFAATGIISAIASGSMKTFCIEGRLAADIIPVDMVSNLIIAAAWAICKFPEKYPNIQIFNGSSGEFNRVDWEEAIREFNSLAKTFPYDSSVRPPSAFLISNSLLYNIMSRFDSFNAAKNQLVCDFLGTDSPLWSHHKKGLHIAETLGYFLVREWKFPCFNTRSIWNNMSHLDREIFHFSASSLNWKKYFKSYYTGTKSINRDPNMEKPKSYLGVYVKLSWAWSTR